EMRKIDDSCLVIVITAYPEVKVAISAMKAGAYDFINKPFELEELKILVNKAVETQRLKSEVERLHYKAGRECPVEMIGNSDAFNKVKELICKIAETPKTPVLIQGETGTGKELVANAVHCRGGRRDMPLIKINCSAIPDNLMESELFGHEKGAFTDAKETKKGLIELADGGTVFFDEIGDMSLNLQPKLLRVLEDQSFRRVGGVRDINVDVRIIAATNRNLKELIKENRFREDLYYRLKVMVIDVPCLRERKEDILPLAEKFIHEHSRVFGKDIRHISPEAKAVLLNYPWHGNIRELKNVIERASILTSSGEITIDHLPLEMVVGDVKEQSSSKSPVSNETLVDIEKAHIQKVIAYCGYNKTRAAQILGISRLTLREKMKKYGIKESKS
ncbi:MAG: sigma-54-dependent Fis family transcriptional regulator, partial [Deltaproteobacteria bacterium]|nr:sigma-54-dependent Fis family transcriptional regulator [Deltaproteobacteria bacterium]